MVSERGQKEKEQALQAAGGGQKAETADGSVRTAPLSLRPPKLSGGQFLLYAVLLLLIFITFIPILYLIVLALKDNGQIYGRFWSLPNPYRWINFTLGSLAIWRPILNSILTSGTSTLVTVVLASLSGYVFARHRFPARRYSIRESWPC